MTQHMLCPVSLTVKGFGRIHMSIVFTDQISFFRIRCYCLLFPAASVVPFMRKVIESIDVLKQGAFLQISYSTGLPSRIQAMCCLIGPVVKRIIVLRFIDPHTPQDNRRMIPVLQYHFFCVLHSLLLPFLSSHILPARNFCKYQKADLIASVNEML